MQTQTTAQLEKLKDGNQQSSIFTRSIIARYYVVKTLYHCKCGATHQGPTSPFIGVVVEAPSGKQTQMPLHQLLNRYKKLFPQRDPMDLIPELPIGTKVAVVQQEQCELCIPMTIGRSQVTELPIDLEEKSGPLESPNDDFDQRVNAQRKGKSKSKGKSRRANPKHAQSKAAYEQGKKIRQGGEAGLDGLLGL